MGKFRGYAKTAWRVFKDVLEIVFSMVEGYLPDRGVLTLTLRTLFTLGPLLGFPYSAVYIQPLIPGVKNLYPWAWAAMALFIFLVIATFWVAYRYRRKLDQHPTVELGKAPIQDGAQYYVPVINYGPGDVEAWVTAINVAPRQGQVTAPNMVPVEHVRWFRGRGNQAAGTPNERKIPEGGTCRLYLVNLSGWGLIGDLPVRDGDIQAANPVDNCNFLAHPGSKVEITLQVFGRPTLSKKTVQTLAIEIPKDLSSG